MRAGRGRVLKHLRGRSSDLILPQGQMGGCAQSQPTCSSRRCCRRAGPACSWRAPPPDSNELSTHLQSAYCMTAQEKTPPGVGCERAVGGRGHRCRGQRQKAGHTHTLCVCLMLLRAMEEARQTGGKEVPLYTAVSEGLTEQGQDRGVLGIGRGSSVCPRSERSQVLGQRRGHRTEGTTQQG